MAAGDRTVVWLGSYTRFPERGSTTQYEVESIISRGNDISLEFIPSWDGIPRFPRPGDHAVYKLHYLVEYSRNTSSNSGWIVNELDSATVGVKGSGGDALIGRLGDSVDYVQGVNISKVWPNPISDMRCMVEHMGNYITLNQSADMTHDVLDRISANDIPPGMILGTTDVNEQNYLFVENGGEPVRMVVKEL